MTPRTYLPVIATTDLCRTDHVGCHFESFKNLLCFLVLSDKSTTSTKGETEGKGKKVFKTETRGGGKCCQIVDKKCIYSFTKGL